MTTELITTITALDRPQKAADQDTLAKFKKERDLYRTTMYKLAEMLKSLNEQKTALLGRFVTPLNGVHQKPNGHITREPDHSPAQGPISTDAISLINEREELDGTEQQLTQELIAKVTRQRDKYREEVYQLKDAITSCQEIVSELEHQLALQERLLLTPKKAPIESPSGSPEPAFSPETLANKKQLELLREEIAQIKHVRIDAKFKDSALQSLILLLFIQAKIQRREPFDIKTFDINKLSSADRELLKQVAQTAMTSMASHGEPVEDVVRKLFATKVRTLDPKIIALSNLRREGKIRTDSIKEITILEGYILKHFAHFFAKLRSDGQQKKEERNYTDFGFTSIAFLSGDLLFAEELYEECKASYERLLQQYKAKPENYKEELRKIPKILVNMEEKIRQIKEVQRLFFALLKNSQVG